MQWLAVTIQTASSGVELVAANLTMWGYDSFMVDDQSEFQEFLEDNTAYWDYVDESLAQKMDGISQITLYLEDNEAAPEALRLLRQQLEGLKTSCPGVELGSLKLTVADVPDEDWANSWRKNYQPVPVGERLLVVPHWLEPENPEDRVKLLLEPGLTFGTGTHQTTQLCMKRLEEVVKGGERVVDLGSGSGILSIAALLLGAKTSVGVDIDPKAEDIARENALLNSLGADRFSAVTANVLENEQEMLALAEGGYDIVLANIVADVIIPMAKIVPAFLREDGMFICSGILDSRVDEVVEAIRNAGLVVLRQDSMDEWCSVCAARHG